MTGTAAVRARLAFCGKAHLRAIVDAGRNVDDGRARLARSTAAATRGAGLGDDPGLAVAAIAGGNVDELAEDALLDATNLAGAVAGGAALGLAGAG